MHARYLPLLCDHVLIRNYSSSDEEHHDDKYSKQLLRDHVPKVP